MGEGGVGAKVGGVDEEREWYWDSVFAVKEVGGGGAGILEKVCGT